jgi:hypothetical protein
VPKIAIREQGLFPVKQSGDRYILSALVTLGAPRHDRIIVPISSRSLHTDPLMSPRPRPNLRHAGLVHALEPHLGILPAGVVNDLPTTCHSPVSSVMRRV